MTSVPDIWNKNEKWCRLQMLLCEGGMTVYKDILSKLGVKDTTNGKDIYRRLQHCVDQSQKQNMQRFQCNALFPSSKDINTDNLDLSLCFLIIKLLDTQKKYPSIVKLRDMRNELCHMADNKREMTVQQFNHYWDQISCLLTDLGCNMNLFRDLKTYNCSSDEFKKRFKDIEGLIKDTHQTQKELFQNLEDEGVKIRLTVTNDGKETRSILEKNQECLQTILDTVSHRSQLQSEGKGKDVSNQKGQKRPNEVDEDTRRDTFNAAHNKRSRVDEEFGRTNLSPKMKDFIAHQMSDNDCKQIVIEYLDNEPEDRLKIENPNNVYDQAYAVICALIKERGEFYWSDMEKVLNNINKEIVKKFTQKFKEAPLQGNAADEDSSDDLQKRDFNFLSKEIGSDWKRFARQFNIEDYKISNIKNKSTEVHDRCFNVFKELARRYGSVKWKPIEMALKELGLKLAVTNYLSWKSTPENV